MHAEKLTFHKSFLIAPPWGSNNVSPSMARPISNGQPVCPRQQNATGKETRQNAKMMR